MLHFYIVNQKEGEIEPTACDVVKSLEAAREFFNIKVRNLKASGVVVSDKAVFNDKSKVMIHSRLYDGDIESVSYEIDGQPMILAIKVVEVNESNIQIQ